MPAIDALVLGLCAVRKKLRYAIGSAFQKDRGNIVVICDSDWMYAADT